MIRLRCLLERHRSRIALAAVLAALCVALTVEHSGFGQEHVGEVASLCLAVLGGAAVVILSAVGVASMRRLRPQMTIWPAAIPLVRAPVIPLTSARDGPASLQVFRR
ncbi:MAG: hypothetical protein ACR2G3_08125 [Solirubrobacterales bacterium]